MLAAILEDQARAEAEAAADNVQILRTNSGSGHNLRSTISGKVAARWVTYNPGQDR